MSWLTSQRASQVAVRQLVQRIRCYASASSGSNGSAPVAEPAAEPAAETSGTNFTDEQDFAKMRDAVRKLSFTNPEQNAQLSPEIRAKLSQEFDQFLRDFVDQVDPSQHSAQFIAEKVSGVDISMFGRMSQGSSVGSSGDGNLSGRSSFPGLALTEPDQPYSDAEIYVRQLFHARRVTGLGADIIGNVYKPHESLHRPVSIAETGVKQLIDAGAHLGHATNRLRANCMPYIYGIREGIHIIDLQQTLAALRRVSRVVEELSRKGGIVLFVGTRDGQRRTVEKAAERSNGFYVYDRWIPGTLTNFQSMNDQKQKVQRIEVNMGDEPTGRMLSSSLHDTIIKPDLAIILNPVENRAMLSECIKLRIPTAGIVDTDSEPSLLTYPVPGNDDSLRFADLVAGVLSRAAERGRKIRLTEFKELQTAKQNMRNGEAAQNAPAPPPRDLAGISELEKQLG